MRLNLSRLRSLFIALIFGYSLGLLTISWHSGLSCEKCVCNGIDSQRFSLPLAHVKNKGSPSKPKKSPPPERGVPEVEPDSEEAVKQYLFPEIYGKREAAVLGTPNVLKEEYRPKQSLLVGIMTQQNYLVTRAKTLYDTWGKEVDKIVFFVGEDCNVSAEVMHLPIIKLPGIPDQVYPPLKKAFAVLEYMADHFIDQFHWFIRGDDDMYARGKALQSLLMKFDSEQVSSIGRPGVGADWDMNRLQLLSHEIYCMGGPAMIFSNAAMRAIRPYLGSCLKAIFRHDELTGTLWHDDDVEIGRCLSRMLDVQCSNSLEAMHVFFYDYEQEALNPNSLWGLPQFQDAITVHPVKHEDSMRSIHHFYKTLEFEQGYERLTQLSEEVNRVCQSLPMHLLPPFYAANCHRQIHTEDVTSFLTTPYITAMEHLPSIANPTNQFDLAPWSYFDYKTVYTANGFSPSHAVFQTLNSEIRHLLKLIERHVQQHSDRRLKVSEFMGGYTRFSPQHGREYIVKMKFTDPADPKLPPQFKRFKVLRPLSPEMMTIEENYWGVSDSVNVVIPVARVDDNLKGFMEAYSESAAQTVERINLYPVVFGSSMAKEVQAVLDGYLTDSSSVHMVVAEGSYKWMEAVERGMKELKDGNQLVFITSTKTRISRKFFHSCRSNTVLSKKVFFPIPFVSFKANGKPTSFASWDGFWKHYSFNYLCITKADYVAIGGYHAATAVGSLLVRAVDYKLEVIQAPEPSLVVVHSGARTCKGLERKYEEKCEAIESNYKQAGPELTSYLSDVYAAEGSPLLYW